MNYLFHLLVMLEIYILLSLSANQIIGMSGLLSLSQAVFYGLGAYVLAILSTKYNLNFWTAFPMVIVITILLGCIYGYIASKVRDLYFSLATLSIQIIFFAICYNWVDLTNGSYGISGIRPISIGSIDINTPISFATFGGLVVLSILVIYRIFLSSPLSKLIEATREDQIAILSLGKNPTYYKTVSICFSAIVSAIAGMLYASYTSYIDPSSFTLDESILILSIILIGGPGGIKGPVIGAMIYTLLPELLKFLHMPDAMAANMRMIIFGSILIAIVRLKPNGLLGKLKIQ